jgi:hypothetical protein
MSATNSGERWTWAPLIIFVVVVGSFALAFFVPWGIATYPLVPGIDIECPLNHDVVGKNEGDYATFSTPAEAWLKVKIRNSEAENYPLTIDKKTKSARDWAKTGLIRFEKQITVQTRIVGPGVPPPFPKLDQ